MTDREMLELAAKAAGIKIDKSPYNGGGHGNTGFDMLGNAVLDWHNYIKWNPLTDDGDAQSLAVKLGINTSHEDPYAVLCGWTVLQRTPITHDGNGPWFWKEWLRDHQNDRAAATRRAITRAAAEVGRSMK